MKLSNDAFACLPGEMGFAFFELERLVVISVRPVMIRGGSCCPLPIMLRAGVTPIAALRY